MLLSEEKSEEWLSDGLIVNLKGLDINSIKLKMENCMVVKKE